MSDVAAAAPRAGAHAVPVAAVAVPLIVAAALALHLNWPMNADTSWLLTACDRMLAGERLYADIAEPNPPMSLWLYLPWAWLGGRTGVAPETLVVLAVLGLCLACVGVSAKILSAAGLIRDRGPWWIAASFALVLQPMLAFAQREHFAIALSLPMLAAIAVRGSGAAPRMADRVVAGLCCGLVVAIKPHFGLAFLAPLLVVAWTQKSWRPLVSTECVIAGGVFALYVVAALALHPEYLSDMLPLAAAVYLPNRAPFAELLAQPAVVLIALALAAWLLRGGVLKDPLAVVLMAAIGGYLAVYLIQGRGYEYHLLPALALALIGLGLSLGQTPAGGALRKVAATAAVVLVAVPLAMSVTVNVLKRDADEIPFLAGLKGALQPLGPGLKIAVLSRDIVVANPLHRMIGATLVNRGPMLWIAGNATDLCHDEPDAARLRTCAEADERERTMLREDLLRSPPDVVIAARMGRDWLAWARADPALAAILDGYRPYRRLEGPQYSLDVLARNDMKLPASESGTRP